MQNCSKWILIFMMSQQLLFQELMMSQSSGDQWLCKDLQGENCQRDFGWKEVFLIFFYTSSSNKKVILLSTLYVLAISWLINYYIKFETIWLGWSITYFKGSKVRILKLNGICVNVFFFYISKECRPWREAESSSISSWSTLFCHCVLLWFPVKKG